MKLEYPNEAYAQAEMEREERYYFDVAYGESRIIPWWMKTVDDSCKSKERISYESNQ